MSQSSIDTGSFQETFLKLGPYRSTAVHVSISYFKVFLKV